MQERNTIVDRDTGGGSAMGIAIVAIIAVAAIVAVLLWQPWNANRSNTTIVNPPGSSQSQTITQPGTGTNGAGAGAGTSGGTSSGSSSGGSGSSGGSEGHGG
ncbi:MAG: hypothetical protein JO359_04465 [Candidatus Eremiobacteraeota bacterium]|nr:hypothetical protein [Candidatus Eremiobacteraeota bacterium]